jgi:3-methyladenine DNA glycosylase AlkC
MLDKHPLSVRELSHKQGRKPSKRQGHKMNSTQKVNFISSLVKEAIEQMDEEYGYLSIAEQGTSHLNQTYLYTILDVLGKIEEI